MNNTFKKHIDIFFDYEKGRLNVISVGLGTLLLPCYFSLCVIKGIDSLTA